MIYKILRMSELLQTLLSNPYFLILLFPVTTLTFFVVGLVLMDLKYLKKPDRNWLSAVCQYGLWSFQTGHIKS